MSEKKKKKKQTVAEKRRERALCKPTAIFPPRKPEEERVVFTIPEAYKGRK
jgi:hypothetical protein